MYYPLAAQLRQEPHGGPDAHPPRLHPPYHVSEQPRLRVPSEQPRLFVADRNPVGAIRYS